MQKMIIISGCSGRMGHVVSAICNGDPNLSVVAGFARNPAAQSEYPVYASPANYTGPADAVIDFSSSDALTPLLDFCVHRNVPVVLATTGYTQAQLDEIRAAARKVAVFRSANMSLGINVLLELVKRTASILGDSYDVEIVERHHNRKVDAPSGTALMIADAAASALPYQPEYVYDRHEVRAPRSKREIGISAVRGGTIVGDHEIIFAGRDEIIELRHSAMSREVFASGAVRAAKFLITQKQPGLYTMEDLVASSK